MHVGTYKQGKQGFTIVELLIVIVVIGILAAITIVAFNGVSNRAKLAAIQSDLESAAKTLETYKFTNNEQYPTDKDAAIAAGVKASGGATITAYIASSATSPASYCLTQSNGTQTYSVTSSTSTPIAGTCVTNLAPNPSFETNTSGWGFSTGTGGSASATLMTNGGAIAGSSNYYRVSWSAAPTVGWGGSQTNGIPVEVGKTYSASAWVRLSRAQNFYIFIRANNYPTVGDVAGPVVSVPANVWTRVTATFTNVPSGVTTLMPNMQRSGSGGWQAGDTLDTDALIFTEGATPQNYADGTTSNWVWNGTANNSTSFGPSV